MAASHREALSLDRAVSNTRRPRWYGNFTSATLGDISSSNKAMPNGEYNLQARRVLRVGTPSPVVSLTTKCDSHSAPRTAFLEKLPENQPRIPVLSRDGLGALVSATSTIAIGQYVEPPRMIEPTRERVTWFPPPVPGLSAHRPRFRLGHIHVGISAPSGFRSIVRGPVPCGDRETRIRPTRRHDAGCGTYGHCGNGPAGREASGYSLADWKRAMWEAATLHWLPTELHRFHPDFSHKCPQHMRAVYSACAVVAIGVHRRSIVVTIPCCLMCLQWCLQCSRSVRSCRFNNQRRRGRCSIPSVPEDACSERPPRLHVCTVVFLQCWL